MSALQKLQEKIEQWRREHDELKLQNANLKSQLAGVAAAQEAKAALTLELENKNTQYKELEQKVESLQYELMEKDEEIEKIIAQVEALLA